MRLKCSPWPMPNCTFPAQAVPCRTSLHHHRVIAIPCRHGRKLACDHASSLTLSECPSRNLEERGFTVGIRGYVAVVATFPVPPLLIDHSRLVGSRSSSSLLDVEAFSTTLASRCDSCEFGIPPNYSRILRIALNGLSWAANSDF
jgi:hypothetical protein